MSYLRLIILPIALMSSIATASEIESTIALCAKTALGERASEEIKVNFENTKMNDATHKQQAPAHETYKFELADSSSGKFLGTVNCRLGLPGQVISSKLQETPNSVAFN